MTIRPGSEAVDYARLPSNEKPCDIDLSSVGMGSSVLPGGEYLASAEPSLHAPGRCSQMSFTCGVALVTTNQVQEILI